MSKNDNGAIMKQDTGTQRAAAGGKRIVSRTDTAAAMILAVAAAAAATVLAVYRIADYLTGPVTLTLPVITTQLSPTDLSLGAEAHYTSVEAVIPRVPGSEAAALAWGEALDLLAVLAVLALMFLLAFRLRRNVLFTAGSAWIIVFCGTVLALAGSAGQAVDTVARTRLADSIGLDQGTGNEYVLFAGTFSFAPAVAGLLLVLVAGAFQYGRRLQRDTEGLI
ncbi:hypothetical protein MUG94_03900 [Arthrobacter gengyunqii]|uniref:DUF2975 domain-containing protein n=1 Tax=Arthrobacter gengyunqii TaxID=2886940 RepID=A0A9X1M3G2_9MICC|nr:hypothetical protein [Arthrobacter gengyunqii]MCC3270227.1 hypothetical protein [Arthrobacter gengyunqii]UOY96932.1 hypothetical protein MUG94_03900 [Arthrobacter gengyunqii]